MSDVTRILVIDNYDSFVYTIVGYLNQLGAETVVVRNDAVPPVAERTGFDGVLVSPGPGTPAEAGQSMQVIRDCADAGTADARRVPRPPGARRGVRRDRDARARAHARQDQPGGAQGRGRARRAARPVHRHAVPLARGRERHGVRRARGHRHRARHHHGPAAPRRSRCTGCSSTPSPCSPRAATGCWPTGSRSAATTRPWRAPRGCTRSSASDRTTKGPPRSGRPLRRAV